MKAVSNHSDVANCTPALIVDRINTMNVHRKDVFDSFRSIGIRVVIVWENDLDLSFSRIEGRGKGHRTIGPNDNPMMILRRTIRDYEPISTVEIDSYHITKMILVNSKMSRRDTLVTILNELVALECLAHMRLGEITTEMIDEAVDLSTKREKQLVLENDSKLSAHASNTITVREGRYELCIHHGKELFSNLFSSFNTNPHFDIKQHFHVTLLFINRKLATELTSNGLEKSQLGTDTLSEYVSAIGRYKSLARSNIAIRPVYIAKNDRVMAIKVEFLQPYSDLPYFDVVPHVSVAKI